ncbi:hypothetical protein GF351_03805 [Candidatus Woesearchaeota archaeon]|nr:hypothetical protein [Candidatus Woesearchaeota archaeon]
MRQYDRRPVEQRKISHNSIAGMQAAKERRYTIAELIMFAILAVLALSCLK